MNNQKTAVKSGERLSFAQLFNQHKFSVEIPKIQRDFAQGRASALEVRESFLNALYGYLEENADNNDLDFVYGSLLTTDDKLKFIPLDGQQRLTTLFLLHWYLAGISGNSETCRKMLTQNGESRFTYETRASSKEFCDALLNSSLNFSSLLPPAEGLQNSLSKTIQDCSWFYQSWQADPTIQSMLTMLDSINSKFSDKPEFFQRLVQEDRRVITFLFLNLEEFQLTDDLYIKMNARGKPLTRFESFKALLEQHIEKWNKPTFEMNYGNGNTEISIQKYFSFNIDTKWADLFWNYRDKTNSFDNRLMNFIRVILANHVAINNDREQDGLEFLLGTDVARKKETYTDDISFQKYKAMSALSEGGVQYLINALDVFSNDDKEIKICLESPFYFDEQKVFLAVLQHQLTWSQRVQFFAYCQFLIHWESEESLEDWMRIVHNLSENTICNGVDEFVRMIKSINKILDHSAHILDYLREDGKIEGFNGQQVQEERIKAILICKNEAWKKSVLKAEQHDYFKGQIGFLLKFSGVMDDYSDSKLEWNDAINEQRYNSFNAYYAKFEALFNENGVVELKDFVWERALLAQGNYLLDKGWNFSFAIDGIERDISWKRLLRGSERNEGIQPFSWEKRDVIKQVLDDEDFDAKNLSVSLEKIISKTELDSTDWRKFFVSTPEMLAYLGKKKYIRFASESEIYLLKKERLSADYAEINTLAFYNSFLRNRSSDFKPFTSTNYKDGSGYDKKPYAVVEKWLYKQSNVDIEIHYDFADRRFKLRLVEKGSEKIDSSIISILESHFGLKNANLEIAVPGADEVLPMLQNLCKAFQELHSAEANCEA